MAEVKGIYPAARAYAREHGQQCAKEIIVWRETAIYSGQKLAELADILRPLDTTRAMRLAEDLVIEVALAKLASDDEPKCEE
ncbi:hypothetical protein D3C80_186120 [compost metagenome]